MNETGLLHEMQISIGRTHSEFLQEMIDDVLDRTGTAPSDLSCIASIVGPGSFTGVRIGVACAQGMALAHHIPTIALNALDVLYAGVKTCLPVVAMLDARRDQVYAAYYGNHKSDEAAFSQAMSLDDLLHRIPQMPTIFVGDGAKVHEQVIQTIMHENAIFPNDAMHLPSIHVAGILALNAYQNSNIIPAMQLQPLYYRLPQAERDLTGDAT